MLKRLLSRDTKEKVAQRAKDALDAAPAVAPASPAPEPAPQLAPAAPPPVARRAKSMRDSDIKDEFGRSAEQLAAEAAKDFDIMGLAARVADMDERPDRPRKSETVATSSNGEFGVIGATPAKPAEPAPVAPAPAAAPTSAPTSDSKAKRLRVRDGHIALPGSKPKAIDATLAARDAYWDKVGRTDPDYFGYPVCPELKGAPAWPTQTQAFRIVRTENSLIIASDGLSDPFAPFRGETIANGYGMEMYIEIPGWQSMDADLVRDSWAFKSIEQLARVCAFQKGLGDLLDEHGVMSVDLPTPCVPNGWVVSGYAEPAGALIDLPIPSGLAQIADMPLSRVRVVPITLIFPEELEDCVVGGPSERKALVNDLMTTGQGHKTDPKRSSLR